MCTCSVLVILKVYLKNTLADDIIACLLNKRPLKWLKEKHFYDCF